MSPKTEQRIIFIVVYLLIILFGTLLFHNTKYLAIHIFGEVKEFKITRNEYRPIEKKHRKNYSDKPFTHAVDYYVDYKNRTHEVFSEAKVNNSENADGVAYYRERIGEKVKLYYLNHVGISEGHNANLNFNIGAFFFFNTYGICAYYGI